MNQVETKGAEAAALVDGGDATDPGSSTTNPQNEDAQEGKTVQGYPPKIFQEGWLETNVLTTQRLCENSCSGGGGRGNKGSGGMWLIIIQMLAC